MVGPQHDMPNQTSDFRLYTHSCGTPPRTTFRPRVAIIRCVVSRAQPRVSGRQGKILSDMLKCRYGNFYLIWYAGKPEVLRHFKQAQHLACDPV